MTPTLMTISSIASAWAGMAALCFQSGTQRHRMGLRELSQQQRWRLAAGGTSLLLLSLATLINSDGPSFGSVLWICQNSVAALTLTCCLPYWRVPVMHSARIAALVAPTLLVSGRLL